MRTCVCNQCDDHPVYQVYASSQVDMAYIGQATLQKPMNLAIPGHDECTHPMLQICACMPYILRCDGKKSNFCVHTCDFKSGIAPVCSFHCTRRSGRLMHAPAHIDATELTNPLTHTCKGENLGTAVIHARSACRSSPNRLHRSLQIFKPRRSILLGTRSRSDT